MRCQFSRKQVLRGCPSPRNTPKPSLVHSWPRLETRGRQQVYCACLNGVPKRRARFVSLLSIGLWQRGRQTSMRNGWKAYQDRSLFGGPLESVLISLKGIRRGDSPNLQFWGGSGKLGGLGAGFMCYQASSQSPWHFSRLATTVSALTQNSVEVSYPMLFLSNESSNPPRGHSLSNTSKLRL